MRLLDLLAEYVLERAISPGASYQLRRSITLFGADRTTDDLQPHPVSEWLLSLENTHAPRTRAGHRGNLLAVWRFAAERGLAALPTGVRRCPKPRPCPRAWTLEDMRRLLAACDHMPDPAWWRLVIEVAFSSGLRRSDLWRLEKIAPDGTIWQSQHKTGYPHVARVPQRAAEEFARRNEKAPLCPSDTRGFYAAFKSLCQLAGVRPGALQMLRRTGATACEIRQAGSASRYLGHRTPGMSAYYVDRSQLPAEGIMPPEP
jgi:integrase